MGKHLLCSGPPLEVMSVIVTRLQVHGKGVENDPVRRITQVWDMSGTLLASLEPLEDD